MKRETVHILILSCLLVLLGSSGRAGADQLVRGYGFDGTSFAPDMILVEPFDPDLGSLNSVAVQLQGMLTVQGNTAVYASGYGYMLQVEQSFLGLGDKLFDFWTPAQYYFSGGASGAGEEFGFARAFNFTFSFTDFSDMLGFVVPFFSGPDVPPVYISGQRSDFLADPFYPICQIDLFQNVLTTTSMGLQFPYVEAHSAGSMIITYDYTPAAEPVPEPASMLLLGSGLLGLAGMGRRRRG